ncbi:MAG: hypothetical protein PUD15_08555 [Prevotella sp.]|nr:hypothetical protein [Prevotella sp.]
MYLVSYIEYSTDDGFFKDFRLFSTEENAMEFFNKWKNDFEEEKKEEVEEEREGNGYASYAWNYGNNELEISVTEIEADRIIIHGDKVVFL